MEKSLWVANSGETSYKRLNSDETADVCVIGGGIAGAVTAYLLAKERNKGYCIRKR